MKKLLVVILTLAIVLNGAYIASAYNEFVSSENLVVGMMEMGFGINSENCVSGSIYGQEYVATYSVEDNTIVRDFEWA